MHAGSVTPVQARLVDLGLGGCYLKTDCVLPLGAEVSLTLKKSAEQVRAKARVVRTSPNEGLAFAFTSMEGAGFQMLDGWLSTFVSTTWAAGNRRRSQRVAIQIKVKVSGYTVAGERFTEDTTTVEISALGGLVNLRSPVNTGQRLALSNPQTRVTAECVVAYVQARDAAWQVGLAFTVPNQPFWPVDFPPTDWSPHHPDAKRFGSGD